MRTAQSNALRSNREERQQHRNGASAIRIPCRRCRTLRGRCRRRRRGAARTRRRRSPSSAPGQAAAASSPPRGRGVADRGPSRERRERLCAETTRSRTGVRWRDRRRRRRHGAASRRRRRHGPISSSHGFFFLGRTLSDSCPSAVWLGYYWRA
jgi:hypothetical protein